MIDSRKEYIDMVILYSEQRKCEVYAVSCSARYSQIICPGCVYFQYICILLFIGFYKTRFMKEEITFHVSLYCILCIYISLRFSIRINGHQ